MSHKKDARLIWVNPFVPNGTVQHCCFEINLKSLLYIKREPFIWWPKYLNYTYTYMGQCTSFGTYLICEHRRLRRVCANASTHQTIRCLHTKYECRHLGLLDASTWVFIMHLRICVFWVLKITVSWRRFNWAPTTYDKKNNFQLRTLIWGPEDAALSGSLLLVDIHFIGR